MMDSLEEKTIEAALKNVENSGTPNLIIPDISGEMVYDENSDTVYFKDKNGNTSVAVSGEGFREYVDSEALK